MLVCLGSALTSGHALCTATETLRWKGLSLFSTVWKFSVSLSCFPLSPSLYFFLDTDFLCLNLASILLYVWGWWHWSPDLLASASQSWDYRCLLYHPWFEMLSDFQQRGLCYGIIYSSPWRLQNWSCFKTTTVMEEWMRKLSLNFLFSFFYLWA